MVWIQNLLALDLSLIIIIDIIMVVVQCYWCRTNGINLGWLWLCRLIIWPDMSWIIEKTNCLLYHTIKHSSGTDTINESTYSISHEVLCLVSVVLSLKTKGHQSDNFVITGGTISCHNDNLQCQLWWQSCHEVLLTIFCFQLSVLKCPWNILCPASLGLPHWHFSMSSYCIIAPVPGN